MKPDKQSHPPVNPKAIRKLYGIIDSAIETGDINALTSVTDSDARVRSRGLEISMTQAITDLNSLLHDCSSFEYTTEITSIELNDDRVTVRTRAKMTLTRKDGVTVSERSSTDTWVHVNGSWRLNDSLLLSTRELPLPTPPERVYTITAELKRQVTSLSTVQPGNSFTDLEAFGQAAGDARVVVIGEATHGTREIFQLRHRLLEYLVKEKGFTVLAIEANWPESDVANRYITTGEGTPQAALAAMYFWTWCTDEFVAIIEWMREFNKTCRRHQSLSFTSFDMQAYDLARHRVLTYMKRHDQRHAVTVEQAYSALDKLNAPLLADCDSEEVANEVDSVVGLLERRQLALISKSSTAAFRDILQMSRIVAQAARLRTKGVDLGYRDQMMAKNIDWILNDAHPKEKVILWAHNAHVSLAPTIQCRPTGSWLRAALGSQMYVLGCAISTGSVRAITFEKGHSIGPAESVIPPSAPGSGTATLSAVGDPMFFLDLRNRSGDLGTWLLEPHLFRTCGSTWDRDAPGDFMNSESLSSSYDGLIFLRDTHATRQVSTSIRSHPS